jgi:hypothetical protein
MPGTRTHDEIKSSWKGFVRVLRSLLSGLPEHRHQDQFLRVKEAALALAETEEMSAAIAEGYQTAVGASNALPLQSARDVVAMELEALPLAVEVHHAEEKAGVAKAGAGKRLRGAAKTILGSVGDVFKLTDPGKSVLCVMKEALDLFDSD